MEPKSRLWFSTIRFKQKLTGACVGYSWAHVLAGSPFYLLNIDEEFAVEKIYWKAQKIDHWPGGEYPDATSLKFGTSVCAAAKVVHSLGLIDSYSWIRNIDDLSRALLSIGPVILGCRWHTDLNVPSSDNFIHVSGHEIARHCVAVVGVNIVSTGNKVDEIQSYFTIQNTFGSNWGINGQANIRYTDLKKLWSGAEVCFPKKN